MVSILMKPWATSQSMVMWTSDIDAKGSIRTRCNLTMCRLLVRKFTGWPAPRAKSASYSQVTLKCGELQQSSIRG